MHVAIICGHGHGDSGAVSKKWGTEANLVRKIAPVLKKELSKYCKVTLLDTSINWYEYLQSHRYDFTKFDYVIELHANSGARDTKGNGVTTGLEAYVPTSEKGISVEQTILKRLCKRYGFKNRGVKKVDYFVIKTIKKQGVSACLLENGFVDDEDDMKIIFNNINTYGKELAMSIAEGFGLKVSKKDSIPVIYVTSYGTCYAINYYPGIDKLEKMNVQGLTTYKLTTGTKGERNLFDSIKNNIATGESHGKRKKGTIMAVCLYESAQDSIKNKIKKV